VPEQMNDQGRGPESWRYGNRGDGRGKGRVRVRVRCPTRRSATWGGSKVWGQWVDSVRRLGPGATRVVILGAVEKGGMGSSAIQAIFALGAFVPLGLQGEIAGRWRVARPRQQQRQSRGRYHASKVREEGGLKQGS
jgi:hypothetical protein